MQSKHPSNAFSPGCEQKTYCGLETLSSAQKTYQEKVWQKVQCWSVGKILINRTPERNATHLLVYIHKERSQAFIGN